MNKDNNQPLTDDSKMWFGKYEGFRLEDVPAWYLLGLYERNKCGPRLREYIEDNMQVLKKELNEKKL